MRIATTINNQKIKFLYSWYISNIRYEYGYDVLVMENEKIIIIDWLRYNKEMKLW